MQFVREYAGKLWLPSMPRPGGNPDLIKYQFTTERSEGLSEQVTIRVGKTMKQLLIEKRIPNWQEVCRQALAKALKENGCDVPDY